MAIKINDDNLVDDRVFLVIRSIDLEPVIYGTTWPSKVN
jgi:hypothetical protein